MCGCAASNKIEAHVDKPSNTHTQVIASALHQVHQHARGVDAVAHELRGFLRRHRAADLDLLRAALRTGAGRLVDWSVGW